MSLQLPLSSREPLLHSALCLFPHRAVYPSLASKSGRLPLLLISVIAITVAGPMAGTPSGYFLLHSWKVLGMSNGVQQALLCGPLLFFRVGDTLSI